MALIKEKLFPNGVAGNYWKITGINLDITGLVILIRVDLFKDSSTLVPLGIQGSRKIIRLPVDPQSIDTGTISDAYLAVKAFANQEIKAAVPATEAVELVRDEDGNITTYAQPARAARPAVYGDADLKDAVDG